MDDDVSPVVVWIPSRCRLKAPLLQRLLQSHSVWEADVRASQLLQKKRILYLNLTLSRMVRAGGCFCIFNTFYLSVWRVFPLPQFVTLSDFLINREYLAGSAVPLLFDTSVCVVCIYLPLMRNCYFSCLFSGHIDVVKFLTETCKVNPFVKDRWDQHL